MKWTDSIAVAFLAMAFSYVLSSSGIVGLLMAIAVAVIVAAFVENIALLAGITIGFVVLYEGWLKKRLPRWLTRREGFQGSLKKQMEVSQAPSIVSRIAGMQHPHKGSEPVGVYDPAIEGFEDLQPQLPKEGASQESTSAPTKVAAVPQINEETIKAVTSAIASETAATKKGTDKSDKQIETEEFQSATNQLFKVGKLPSENEEGPKLDVGNTLVKAMNSLDPNTITAMTADTKKLLETQKGLMSMLNQMRPVLADGKELLQTFSGMFGGVSPSGPMTGAIKL